MRTHKGGTSWPSSCRAQSGNEASRNVEEGSIAVAAIPKPGDCWGLQFSLVHEYLILQSRRVT